MQAITRWISVAALAASLLVAGGCAMPSNKALYDIAAGAAKSDSLFPKTGKIEPYTERTVFPCKNAACVRVAYSFTDEAGVSQRATYTVWLKRVALTWVPDRCHPTPSATTPASQTKVTSAP